MDDDRAAQPIHGHVDLSIPNLFEPQTILLGFAITEPLFSRMRVNSFIAKFRIPHRIEYRSSKNSIDTINHPYTS